jgi:hypothetical protein
MQKAHPLSAASLSDGTSGYSLKSVLLTGSVRVISEHFSHNACSALIVRNCQDIVLQVKSGFQLIGIAKNVLPYKKSTVSAWLIEALYLKRVR